MRVKHNQNGLYRLNTTLKVELFKLKPLSLLSSSILFFHLGLLSNAYAAPQGGAVVGGSGSIHTHGNTTAIHQSSQNMAIDWQSYNVQQNERVHYIQPNSRSISLNRILGNNASTIRGKIDANGQIILVNPNGIFFSPTATINVGGIMASGLDIKPSDFMNGKYIFNEVAGTDGFVLNSGIINAATGGNVTLLGKHVKNNGMIVAKLGAVNMAAGKAAVVTFDNAGLLGVRITKEVLQNELGIDPAVLNNGTINANGGRILLTASVSRDIFSKAVNTGSIKANNIVAIGDNVTNSGHINADSAIGNAGNIELHATHKTLLTKNSTTTAQATHSGKGGNIKILGNKVGLFDNAQVNASGVNGGGTVLIGGDKTGANQQIRNADFIYLGKNTSVKADATQNGNGGKLITFASNTARIYGNLSAKGGAQSGNGGFIETSGLKGFEITGAPDTSAAKGKGGEWLIDPYDITIADVQPGDIPFPNPNPNSPNVFFYATKSSSVLDVNLIYDGLLNGKVSISTNGTGTDVGNITVATDIFFNQGNNTALTLEAANNINIQNKQIRADLDNQGRPRRDKTLDIILTANSDNIGGGDVNLTNATIYTNGGKFSATGVNVNLSGGIINTVSNNFTNRRISGTTNRGGDVNITATGTADTTIPPVPPATTPTIQKHPASINIGTDIITDGGAVLLVVNKGGATAGTITVNNKIDTTKQPGSRNRNQAATNKGTVSLSAEGGITLGGNILTDGKKVDIIKSTSFTSTANIDTSNGNKGDVAINSTGNIISGGSITTNNGKVDFNNSATQTTAGKVTLTGAVNTNGGAVNINNGANLGTVGQVAIKNTMTTGGGNLTIKQSSQYNSTVSGTIKTGSGAVVINSTGKLTSGGTITTNNGNINLKTTTGAVTISNTITTGTGNLTVDTSGAINANAALKINNATFGNAAGSTGNITISNANNAFAGSVTFNNASGNITINDADGNGLDIAQSNLGVGNFTATANGITQSGAITQTSGLATFNAGNNTINLTQSNNFNGSVALNNSGNNNVAISNSGLLTIGTSNIGSGTLTVNAVGIQQTGTDTLTQATNAGLVTLKANAGVINLNNANDFTGNVSLTNTGANDVTIQDANAITLGASTLGGNLNVTAGTGSDILQVPTGNSTTNGLTVAGTSTFTVDGGRSISLGNTNNNFKGLSFTAKANTGRLRNVTVANARDLDLQTLNLSGNLDVTARGSITNSGGSMVVNGLTRLNATDTNNNTIRLDVGANNFTNMVITNGGNVTISDIDGINIGDAIGNPAAPSTITGNLTINANGNITQTAALTNTNTATATFTAGSGNITLTAAANDFNILNITTTGNATVVDSNAIQLGAVKANGALSITTGNDVNGNGIIEAAGSRVSSSGQTTLVSSGRIQLGTGNHDFNHLVFTGTDVAINDTNNINLGTGNANNAKQSTATSNVSLSANGNITDIGSTANKITGVASLNSGSGDIALANTDFQNTLTITAKNNITINDATGLTLGTIRAAKAIDLTAGDAISGGNLTATEVKLLATSGINTTTHTAVLTVENIDKTDGNNTIVKAASGDITLTNTGRVEIKKLVSKTGLDTAIGNVTFKNTGDVNVNPGSIDTGFNEGNLVTPPILLIDVTNGSLFGLGTANINKADITAYIARFTLPQGFFGSIVRPIVLNVKKSVFISARGGISPRLTPPGPIDGVIKPDSLVSLFDVSTALSGEQLIKVEELEDIDPAIFSDVRNYTYGQVAIRLPRDQLFDDELKERDGK